MVGGSETFAVSALGKGGKERWWLVRGECKTGLMGERRPGQRKASEGGGARAEERKSALWREVQMTLAK